MTENISIALEVLGVGMVTVFVILALVVASGHLLIKVVNKYFPAPLVSTTTSSKSHSSGQAVPSTNISKSTLAAIISSVDVITEGKGKVTEIKRMD